MQSIIDKLIIFLLRKRIRGGVRLRNFFCTNRRIKVDSKHGIRLLLDPFEGIDLVVLRDGFYEEEVHRAVVTHLRDEDVFWDIGSNLGIHALTVKKLHPTVDVFAFEPNPEMNSLLLQSTKANQVAIKVFDFALSNDNGTCEFFIHEGNTGRCGLHNPDGNPDLKTVQVSTIKGDTLIEQGRARAPNIIKIDVEGHELSALQGLSKTLDSSTLRVVVFEDKPEDETFVKMLLRTKGFRLSSLSRIDSKNPSLENYIALRAGQ